MAIATYADLLALAAKPSDVRQVFKAAISTNVGALTTVWSATGTPDPAGAVPSTAAALGRTTAGALGQNNGGATALRLLRSHFSTGSLGASSLILCDRLSHMGGLSGTTTGAQTTNLPTAALTRYTSGVGVQIGIEIHSAIGTSATTITASYTNQAGTSGQATPLVAIGGTAQNQAQKMFILPLASGDTGVKSVESITLAASTGTAGNIGVVLFKPLVPMVYSSIDAIADQLPALTFGGFMPEILDDACLFFIGTTGSSSASVGPLSGIMKFSED